MDSKIDWAALDYIVEYLCIQDVELLTDTLLILKDYCKPENDNNPH